MGSDHTPILDRDSALARLGGDQQLFEELANFVREDAPPLLQQLTAVVNSNDAKAVREKAHALKGLVAGCGGVRAAEIAQQLENAGQAGNLSQAKSLVGNLQIEIDALLNALPS
jgi:HPt (histidine-containing phosphotransfer) domain-containing protein